MTTATVTVLTGVPGQSGLGLSSTEQQACLESRIAKLESEKQRRKVDMAMMRKENKGLIEEINRLERKLIKYSHELKARNNWKLKFQMEYEHLLYEKQELEQELVKVEHTLGNAEQVMCSHNDTIEDFERHVKELERDLRHSKSETSKYKTLLLRVQEDFRQKYGELCSRLLELAGENTRLVRDMAELSFPQDLSSQNDSNTRATSIGNGVEATSSPSSSTRESISSSTVVMSNRFEQMARQQQARLLAKEAMPSPADAQVGVNVEKLPPTENEQLKQEVARLHQQMDETNQNLSAAHNHIHDLQRTLAAFMDSGKDAIASGDSTRKQSSAGTNPKRFISWTEIHLRPPHKTCSEPTTCVGPQEASRHFCTIHRQASTESTSATQQQRRGESVRQTGKARPAAASPSSHERDFPAAVRGDERERDGETKRRREGSHERDRLLTRGNGIVAKRPDKRGSNDEQPSGAARTPEQRARPLDLLKRTIFNAAVSAAGSPATATCSFVSFGDIDIGCAHDFSRDLVSTGEDGATTRDGTSRRYAPSEFESPAIEPRVRSILKNGGSTRAGSPRDGTCAADSSFEYRRGSACEVSPKPDPALDLDRAAQLSRIEAASDGCAAPPVAAVAVRPSANIADREEGTTRASTEACGSGFPATIVPEAAAKDERGEAERSVTACQTPSREAEQSRRDSTEVYHTANTHDISSQGETAMSNSSGSESSRPVASRKDDESNCAQRREENSYSKSNSNGTSDSAPLSSGGLLSDPVNSNDAATTTASSENICFEVRDEMDGSEMDEPFPPPIEAAYHITDISPMSEQETALVESFGLTVDDPIGKQCQIVTGQKFLTPGIKKHDIAVEVEATKEMSDGKVVNHQEVCTEPRAVSTVSSGTAIQHCEDRRQETSPVQKQVPFKESEETEIAVNDQDVNPQTLEHLTVDLYDKCERLQEEHTEHNEHTTHKDVPSLDTVPTPDMQCRENTKDMEDVVQASNKSATNDEEVCSDSCRDMADATHDTFRGSITCKSKGYETLMEDELEAFSDEVEEEEEEEEEGEEEEEEEEDECIEEDAEGKNKSDYDTDDDHDKRNAPMPGRNHENPDGIDKSFPDGKTDENNDQYSDTGSKQRENNHADSTESPMIETIQTVQPVQDDLNEEKHSERHGSPELKIKDVTTSECEDFGVGTLEVPPAGRLSGLAEPEALLNDRSEVDNETVFLTFDAEMSVASSDCRHASNDDDGAVVQLDTVLSTTAHRRSTSPTSLSADGNNVFVSAVDLVAVSLSKNESGKNASAGEVGDENKLNESFLAGGDGCLVNERSFVEDGRTDFGIDAVDTGSLGVDSVGKMEHACDCEEFQVLKKTRDLLVEKLRNVTVDLADKEDRIVCLERELILRRENIGEAEKVTNDAGYEIGKDLPRNMMKEKIPLAALITEWQQEEFLCVKSENDDLHIQVESLPEANKCMSQRHEASMSDLCSFSSKLHQHLRRGEFGASSTQTRAESPEVAAAGRSQKKEGLSVLRVDEPEFVVQSLMSQVSELCETNATLAGEVISLRAGNASLTEQLTADEEADERESVGLRSAAQRLNEDLSMKSCELAELERQRTALRTSLEEQREMFDASLSENALLRTRESCLANDISVANEELLTKTRKLTELEQQRTALHTSLEEQREMFDASSRENALLRTRESCLANDISVANEQLATALSDKLAAASQYDALRSELSTAYDQQVVHIGKLADENASLCLQLSQLTEKLSQVETALESHEYRICRATKHKEMSHEMGDTDPIKTLPLTEMHVGSVEPSARAFVRSEEEMARLTMNVDQPSTFSTEIQVSVCATTDPTASDPRQDQERFASHANDAMHRQLQSLEEERSVLTDRVAELDASQARLERELSREAAEKQALAEHLAQLQREERATHARLQEALSGGLESSSQLRHLVAVNEELEARIVCATAEGAVREAKLTTVENVVNEVSRGWQERISALEAEKQEETAALRSWNDECSSQVMQLKNSLSEQQRQHRDEIEAVTAHCTELETEKAKFESHLCAIREETSVRDEKIGMLEGYVSELEEARGDMNQRVLKLREQNECITASVADKDAKLNTAQAEMSKLLEEVGCLRTTASDQERHEELVGKTREDLGTDFTTGLPAQASSMSGTDETAEPVVDARSTAVEHAHRENTSPESVPRWNLFPDATENSLFALSVVQPQEGVCEARQTKSKLSIGTGGENATSAVVPASSMAPPRGVTAIPLSDAELERPQCSAGELHVVVRRLAVELEAATSRVLALEALGAAACEENAGQYGGWEGKPVTDLPTSQSRVEPEAASLNTVATRRRLELEESAHLTLAGSTTGILSLTEEEEEEEKEAMTRLFTGRKDGEATRLLAQQREPELSALATASLLRERDAEVATLARVLEDSQREVNALTEVLRQKNLELASALAERQNPEATREAETQHPSPRRSDELLHELERAKMSLEEKEGRESELREEVQSRDASLEKLACALRAREAGFLLLKGRCQRLENEIKMNEMIEQQLRSVIEKNTGQLESLASSLRLSEGAVLQLTSELLQARASGTALTSVLEENNHQCEAVREELRSARVQNAQLRDAVANRESIANELREELANREASGESVREEVSQQLGHMLEKLHEKEERANILQDKLATGEEATFWLQQRVEQLTASCSKLEVKISASSTDAEALRNLLNVKDGEVKCLEAQLSAAEQKRATVTDQESVITQLQDAVAEKAGEIISLEGLIEAFRVHETTRDNETRERTEQLVFLQGSIETYRERETARETEIKQLQDDVVEKTQMMMSLQSSIEAYRVRETMRDDETKEMTDQLTSLQESIETLRERETARDTEIIQLQDAVREKAVILETLQESIETYRERETARGSELMQLQDAVWEKTGIVESLQELIETSRERETIKDKETSEMTEKLMLLQESIETYREHETARDTEMRQLQDAVREKTEVEESLQASIETYRERVTVRDDETRAMTDQIMSLQESIETNRERETVRDTEMIQLQDAIREKTVLLETLQELIETYRERETHKGTEMEQLQNSVKEKTEVVESLQASIATYRERETIRDNEASEMTEQLEFMQESIETYREHEATRDTKTKEMTVQLVSLQESIEACIERETARVTEMIQLQDAVREKTEIVESLQESIETSREREIIKDKETREMTEKFMLLQESIETYREHETARDTEMRQLQNAVKEKTEVVESLQASIATYRERETIRDNEASEMTEQLEFMQESIETYREHEATRDTETKEMTVQLVSLQESIETYRERETARGTEMAQLQDAVREKTEILESLQESIETSRERETIKDKETREMTKKFMLLQESIETYREHETARDTEMRQLQDAVREKTEVEESLQASIETYRERETVRDDETRAMTDQIMLFQESIETYRERETVRDTEMIQLQDAIREKAVMLETLQESIETYRERETHRGTEMEQLQNAVKEKTEVVESLQASIATYREREIIRDNEASEMTEQLEFMQESIETYREHEATRDTETKEMTVQLVSLQESIETYRERETARGTEMTQLHDAVREKTEIVENLQESIETSRERATIKDKETREMTEKLMLLQESIETYREHETARDTEMRQLQDAVREKTDVEESLQASIETYRERETVRDTEMIQLQDAIREKAVMLETLQESIETYRERETHRGTEMIQLQNAVKEKTEVVESLQASIATYRERETIRDNEASEMTEQLEFMQESIETYREHEATRDTETKEMTVQLVSLQESIEAYRERETARGTEMIQLQDAVREKTEIVESLQESIETSRERESIRDNETREMTEKLMLLQESIETYREHETARDTEMVQLEDAVKEKTEEADSLRVSLETYRERETMRDEVTREMTEKLALLQESTEAYRERETTRDNDTSELKEQVKFLQESNETYREREAIRDAEVMQLQDAARLKTEIVEGLQESIDAYRERETYRDTETQELTEQLVSLQQSIETYKEREMTREIETKQLQEEVASLRGSIEACRERETAWRDTKQELAHFRELLFAGDEELHDMQQQLEEARTREKQAEASRIEKEDEIVSLHQCLEGLSTQYRAAKEKLAQKEESIQDLKLSLTEKDEEIESYGQLLGEKSRELKSMRDLLKEVEDKVDYLQILLEEETNDLMKVKELCQKKETVVFDLQEHVDRKEKDLFRLKQCLVDEEQANRSVHVKLHNKEVEITEQSEEVQTLRDDLLTQQQQLGEAKSECCDKDKIIFNLTKQTKELKERLKIITTENEELESKLRETNLTITEYKTQVQKKSDHVERLSISVKSSEEEVIHLCGRLKSADDRVDALSKELEEVQVVLDKLVGEVNQQCERLAEYEEADYGNQRLVRHLQVELKKLQLQLAEERCSTGQALERLRRLQGDLDDDQSQALDLEAQVKRLECEKLTLLHNLHESTHSHKVLVQDISALQDHVYSLRTELQLHSASASAEKISGARRRYSITQSPRGSLSAPSTPPGGSPQKHADDSEKPCARPRSSSLLMDASGRDSTVNVSREIPPAGYWQELSGVILLADDSD